MAATDIVEVTTGKDPLGSIIWLHGLGADGHDFEPIVPELRLPEDMPLRFLFPHAPVRAVTINGGMEMRAWYDITSFDKQGRADDAGITASSEIVEELIEGELDRGVPADKIVVAGFSQGGAIALNILLTTRHALAGIMALSSYVALPAAASNASMRRHIPILMAHGSFDPVLPLALGVDSREHLRTAGFDPEWHEYPMAHAVCPDEISAISAWLQRIYGRRIS